MPTTSCSGTHEPYLKLWQFITYQFLHASPMHLIGNMIFLWVFGKRRRRPAGQARLPLLLSLHGRSRRVGDHWLTSDHPVLGASGSVAGVTGAFLALFPRTHITFLFVWLIIRFFQVPAMLVVAFYFAKDLFFLGMGVGNTAYTAHLAGNLGGFSSSAWPCSPRALLPREPYDLYSLLGA